jgi:hypothetical protein
LLNRLIAAAVVAVVLVVGALGLVRLLDWRAGLAFGRIRPGEAEAKVLMYLGSPSKTEPCGGVLWWADQPAGRNDGRCISQARYQYAHSAWIVGYDADRKVVSKHHETGGG